MNIQQLSLYDRLLEIARSHPDATALVCGSTRLTYGEMPERITRLVNGMCASGLESGQRIAFLLDNSVEHLLLIAAGFRLGTVSVCINTRTSAEEMRLVFEQTGPRQLVYEKKYEEQASQLSHMLPGGLICMDPDGNEVPSVDQWLNSGCEEPEIEEPSPDAGAIIIPTAAVGGIPKGALLSQNNIRATVLAHLIHFGEETMSGLLSVLPTYHAMGLSSAWTTLLSGGKVVLQPHFAPEEAVRAIDAEDLSYFSSFPPILERVLDEAKSRNSSMKSLKLVYGLEGPQNIQRLEEETGARFWTGFGQAETTEFVTYCRATDHPGTAGIPTMLNRVELFNDAGEIVPVGAEGEIAVRGPNVFLGYWDMPEETAHAHRNGWHHTGDIGRFDEQGRLVYVKRKAEKELIKTGGENVYPGEVEAVLLKHPSIEACCVIGVPDPTWGEMVLAVCRLVKGASLEEETVRDFVGSHIAGFKKPRKVCLTESLPVKDGEVNREAVRKQFG